MTAMGKRIWKRMLVVLALFLMLVFPVAGARGADWLDPSFGSGGLFAPALPEEASQKEAGIVDLAATPDGQTVGALKGLAGPGYFGAVRLTPSGAPDSTFGQSGFTPALAVPQRWPGFNQEAQAEAVAVQGDGKTVVAGFLQEGLHDPTVFTMLLARYQPDGSPDPGFGSGGIVLGPHHFGPGGTVIHAAAIAPDGRIIVVGGSGESSRGTERSAGVVYAFNPDGSLDKNFGSGGRVLFSQRTYKTYTSLRDIELLGSGKILVAGYHDYRLFLARLHADGRRDRGFGGGDGSVTLGIRNGTCCPPASVAVQGNGRIVVAANGGPFHRDRVYLVRYRPNGSLDRRFGKRGVSAPFRPWRLFRVNDVAVQANGGILTVGPSAQTKRNSPGGAYAVFRNDPDGSPDDTFGNQGLLSIAHGEFGDAGAALSRLDGGVLTGGSSLKVDQGTGRYVTSLLLARFSG